MFKDAVIIIKNELFKKIDQLEDKFIVKCRINRSDVISKFHSLSCYHMLLPARASEQGNVNGSVRIYICVCTKKNCN